MCAAFGSYLGGEEGCAAWQAYDATHLITANASLQMPILLDQGTADNFYMVHFPLSLTPITAQYNLYTCVSTFSLFACLCSSHMQVELSPRVSVRACSSTLSWQVWNQVPAIWVDGAGALHLAAACARCAENTAALTLPGK